MSNSRANVVDLCGLTKVGAADQVLFRALSNCTNNWNAVKRSDFDRSLVKLLARSLEDFTSRCESISHHSAANLARELSSSLISASRIDSSDPELLVECFEESLGRLHELLTPSVVEAHSDSGDTRRETSVAANSKPFVYYLSAKNQLLDHCKQCVSASGFEVKTFYQMPILLSEHLNCPADHWLVDLDGLSQSQIDEIVQIRRHRNEAELPNLILVSQDDDRFQKVSIKRLSHDHLIREALSPRALVHIFHRLEIAQENQSAPIVLVSADSNVQSKFMRAATHLDSSVAIVDSLSGLIESVSDASGANNDGASVPSVLILDIANLGINVVQEIKNLRANELFSHTAIIVSAGFGQENLHLPLLQVGITDFVMNSLAPSWILKIAGARKQCVEVQVSEQQVASKVDRQTGAASEIAFLKRLQTVVRERAHSGHDDCAALIHLNFQVDYRAIEPSLIKETQDAFLSDDWRLIGSDNLIATIVNTLVDELNRKDMIGVVFDQYLNDRCINIVSHHASESQLISLLEKIRTMMQSLSFAHFGKKDAVKVFVGCASVNSKSVVQLRREAYEQALRASRSATTDYCYDAAVNNAVSIPPTTAGFTSLESQDRQAATKIIAAHKTLTALRSAIDGDRLSLAYQSIESGNTQVDMQEVYLRVRDEDNALMNSGELIDVAKTYGMGRYLDRWVFSNALDFLHETRVDGCTKQILFLKVTQESLLDQSFQIWFADQINDRNIDPGAICLQVTSHDVFACGSVVKQFFEHCYSIGVGVAVEGFNYETSSLTQMRLIANELGYIKLDAQYIDRLSWDARVRHGFASVRDFCDRHSVCIITPFIETEYAQKMFERLGVDCMQGYYIGEPMNPAQLAKKANKSP